MEQRSYIGRGAVTDFLADGKYLRRDAAANYLKQNYGFGALGTLAKGVVTGDGPAYRKAGRQVLYRKEDLDAWAQSKISAPQKSSSDSRDARPQDRAEKSPDRNSHRRKVI